MSQEDHERTRRHFDVVAEGLRSDIRQVAEGVTSNAEALERLRAETTRELAAVRSEADAFRVETTRSLATVRSEAEAFRVETTRNFATVQSAAEAFRAETTRNFATVHSEAEAFRVETARNFAVTRADIAGGRAGRAPLARPRSRRRSG